MTPPPFEAKSFFSVDNSGPNTFDNSLADQDSMVIAGVEKHQDNDQIQFTPWRRFIFRFFFLTGLIPLVLNFWAAKIQIGTLLASANNGTLSPTKLRLAWAVLLVEMATAVDALFGVFIKSSTLFGRWRPRLRLLGNNVPSVDIIIPVCNEKLDIIQDTVRGALNIDYPRHRFRIIVTDDGANGKLEAWILQLAATIPNLYYTARVKVGTAGYKAGNINHAVAFSETLPGGSAELIAGLDADMIPERHWLRAVTAHIVRDSKMGMVCPTQLFYNVPVNDPLTQTRSWDWLRLDIVRDHAGAGLNLGSGWVLRRTALDDINGFPTDCLVEDICSSMLQISAGWRTAYIPEGLQYGLIPETYGSHVKQLCRWYIGGSQMFLRFGGYVSRRVTKKMPLHIRLLGFSGGFAVHVKPHLGTLSLLLTPAVFLTGTQMVYFQSEDEFKLLFRLQCAVVLTKWLHDWHIGSYRVAMSELGLVKYMSPYYTMVWMRTFILPDWLGGKKAGFTPTGSIANNVQERSAARRGGLKARLYNVAFDCGAWLHFCVIVILLGTAGFRAWHIMGQNSIHGGDNNQMWADLLKTVLWPSQHWSLTVLGFAVPFTYAVSPPTMPDRDGLMGKREGEFGARYPTEQAKKVKSDFCMVDFAWFYTFFIVAVALGFIGSWRWF
ncbi:cellulose synthase 2 [Cladorrhinum sp. PSN332]|nr:cellulose synthase 2 [Cladorrhinum sp. PSN332]